MSARPIVHDNVDFLFGNAPDQARAIVKSLGWDDADEEEEEIGGDSEDNNRHKRDPVVLSHASVGLVASVLLKVQQNLVVINQTGFDGA